jgi:hypothetical protein
MLTDRAGISEWEFSMSAHTRSKNLESMGMTYEKRWMIPNHPSNNVIENILDVQETPKKWFPGYICDMHSSTTIETAPLENFEALRRRIEGNVGD